MRLRRRLLAAVCLLAMAIALVIALALRTEGGPASTLCPSPGDEMPDGGGVVVSATPQFAEDEGTCAIVVEDGQYISPEDSRIDIPTTSPE